MVVVAGRELTRERGATHARSSKLERFAGALYLPASRALDRVPSRTGATPEPSAQLVRAAHAIERDMRYYERAADEANAYDAALEHRSRRASSGDATNGAAAPRRRRLSSLGRRASAELTKVNVGVGAAVKRFGTRRRRPSTHPRIDSLSCILV